MVKVNVDENPKTAIEYQIRSIPSLLLFKDGEVLDIAVGALPKSELESWLQSHI